MKKLVLLVECEGCMVVDKFEDFDKRLTFELERLGLKVHGIYIRAFVEKTDKDSVDG